ncbi:hypothetical protein D3C78_1216230 [compost metagenome]
MQHSAHGHRCEHLVRGLHDAVRATSKCPGWQRRVLPVMRPMRLIHKQRYTAVVTNTREGRKITTHAVIIRHGNKYSCGFRIGCKCSLNSFCRRRHGQVAEWINQRLQKNSAYSSQHQSMND